MPLKVLPNCKIKTLMTFQDLHLLSYDYNLHVRCVTQKMFKKGPSIIYSHTYAQVK